MAEGTMVLRIIIIAGIAVITAGFLLAPALFSLLGKFRAAVGVVVQMSREEAARQDKPAERPLKLVPRQESNWSRSARLEALR